MTTKHTMFRLAAALSILVCMAATRHLGTAVAALFNENNAVHVEPDAIESATLIIGTHLIYLHALNEEIYAAALDSASLSGQDRRFYKSELAGGMWVEITDAGSVRDITAAGNIVDKSEIQALFLTHHTKSDRVTYDLRTNAKVCIFDIYNVYDLENMPELEPLKLQYDMMKESGSKTKTIKRNTNLVQNFFAMQVRSDTTAAYDRQIQALQGYYDELAANGAESRDSEMALKVMAKIDNSRKAAVYTLIENGLASLQDQVADVSGNADLELDDALLTAIGNSQNALAESMSEAQGNMLVRGDTVLSETEYTLSEEMITNAMGGNYFACDGQNQKLQYLQNISAGVIADRLGETELLNGMIDKADVAYGQMLSRGVTNEYMTLVSQNVSHAALQSRMKADMVDANAARGEVEFFIQGKADRMEREEAQNYILMRIQDAAKFKAAVKTDTYQAEYQNSVSAYVDWLNALLDSIRSNGTSQTEEEGMYEQKADLQQQKLQALDGLDLDTAKKIDAQIAEIDAKIDATEGSGADKLSTLTQQKAELEKELQKELEKGLQKEPSDQTEDFGEPDSDDDSAVVALQVEISRLEVEIAENRMALPENSQAANIVNSKNEILRLLAEEDAGDSASVLMESHVGVLVAMLAEGSPLAREALKEVYQKLLAKSELEGIGAYQDLQDQIETAISDSVVNTSLSGEMTVQGAQRVIADALGIESLTDAQGNLLPDIPKEDMAAALIALGEFDKKTSRTAQTMGTADESGAAQPGTEADDGTDGSGVMGENDGTGSNLNAGEGTGQGQHTGQGENTGDTGNQVSNEADGTEDNKTGKDNTDEENTGKKDNVGEDDTGKNDNADKKDNAGGKDGNGESSRVEEPKTDGTGSVKPSEIHAMIEGLAAALSQGDDGIVFQTKKQGSECYVPAETLADYLGYRYIWNDTRKSAVLSRGRCFYRFTAFRENVENEAGETVYMDSPAGFSGGIYIPESFVENCFACRLYEISGTGYSILVNDMIEEKSQEIFSELMEKGGF